MTALLLIVGCVIFLYFTLFFLVGCFYKNYGVADIGWGLGFIVTAITAAYATNSRAPIFWLAMSLVFLWGNRLSIYIYFRNKNKPEDFRYRQFRDKWIRFPYLTAFIKLYLTQAVIMLIVSTCILIAAVSDASINLISWLFCAIAVFGFLYESLSDYQLSKFKKDPDNRGKIMMQGLWRYSRHPNYFGEIVFWWGLSSMIAASTGNPFALISGLVMNVLIVSVSGVPMLEGKYKNNPTYSEYIRTTNSLIPIRFH